MTCSLTAAVRGVASGTSQSQWIVNGARRALDEGLEEQKFLNKDLKHGLVRFPLRIRLYPLRPSLPTEMTAAISVCPYLRENMREPPFMRLCRLCLPYLRLDFASLVCKRLRVSNRK